MDSDPINLTTSQIDEFFRDGYLQVENLLTEAEIDSFVAQESEIVTPDPRGLRHHVIAAHWKIVAHHPNVAGIAQQLLNGPPRIVQTMYMAKEVAHEQETGGAGTALHQDACYLPNEPNTLMACWIAMNDTDADKGGLCMIKGSNHSGLRSTHFNENAKEHNSWRKEYGMRAPDGRAWVQEFYSFRVDGITSKDLTQLTVSKGSGIFLRD